MTDQSQISGAMQGNGVGRAWPSIMMTFGPSITSGSGVKFPE